MSNYTKTTDFEAKDSLPTGDSGKIIRGAEFETEFDAISTAIATKADTAGPTFTGTLTFETISDGTIGVTAFVDEDDMSSNSATLVPTQQSVKAYVDSQVTAQDLDFQADSGGALSIDLDSETMTFTGGTGIDTSGSGNAVTFAIDSTVATLTGSQTLTNKTLTSPVLNTGVSGTAVLDEDDMASNSATQLATQQSIKAYVNSQVAANNELSEILANGNTTGGSNIVFGDSASVSDDRLVFGAGSDLQIYHSGVHSYIDDAGTGNLTLRGNASVRVEKYEGEILADFAADGAVSLYHDNSVKIATTSTGVNVTGNVAVSGTVDGRDVATDGTKLDGIEASADVTDTANVTAAGALMDSELTSEASVKALNQGVATTDSPTFAGVTVNGTVEFDGLSGTGSVNVTDILDQDDMSSNSATALATQQSIKAYVDSQVATADTLSEVLANGNTTGGTNIVFGDSSGASDDRLVFGAGTDLQIYHDGSNSYIADTGTGNLNINASNLALNDASGNFYITGSDSGTGGTVRLYHEASQKLVTESTGINVTGTVTSDGLTVDGSATITTADNNAQLTVVSTDTDASVGPRIDFHRNSSSPANGDLLGEIQFQGEDSIGSLNIFATISSKADQVDNGAEDGSLRFKTLINGSLDERLIIASDGHVGIGTSTPATELHVNGKILTAGGTAASPALQLNDVNSGLFSAGGNTVAFSTDGSERMRIDSSGNFGIGTTSIGSSTKLQVAGRGLFTDGLPDPADGSPAGVAIGYNTTSGYGFIQAIQTGVANKDLYLQPSGSNNVIIANSGGNVGIGTSSPATSLHVNSGANGEILRIQGADAQLRINNTTSNVMDINSSGSGDSLTLSTNDTERMRIDSSGNLLVGATTTTNLSDGTGNDGVQLNPSGTVAAARTSNVTAVFNRLSTDGEIARFNKDGTSVGSIGTSNGRLTIGDASVGVRFADDLDTIVPWNVSTNAARDAGIDLGNGSVRFKDLYLSGTANAATLSVATTASTNVLIKGGDGNSKSIVFQKDTGSTQQAKISTVGDDLRFTTGTTSERMRLDSSGNLLVGTTTTTAGNEGMVYFNGSSLRVTRDGDEPLNLDRLTSDGSLVDFKKDGTTVGAIGVINSDNLRIGGSVADHAGLQFALHEIVPMEANVDSDGTISLGSTNSKFKDIFLSGNITSSGTFRGGAGSASTPTFLTDGSTGMYRASSNDIGFSCGGSERARIDSSGNLLVGKTNNTLSNDGTVIRTGGEILVTNTSDIVANFNRTGTDGSIVELYKDGSSVGTIGAAGGDLTIGTGDTGLTFEDAANVIHPINAGTGAARDDAIDLGKSAARFDDIHATNGTIQTSDRNEKQDIEALSEAEQRVAVACKGLLRKFRWKSSVANKGDDARIHFGIIAQDLQAAFTAEGLDAGRYGMFINSTWTDEETGEERSRMGVRYSELLAFIIAAI